MGLNLLHFTNDHDRASLMLDYASDPRGLIADTCAALAEAGYGDGDSLPEDLCGPISATLGAAMLYEVWLRVSTGHEVTGYDYDEVSAGASSITHGLEHGDSLAEALYGQALAEVIVRLEDWVLDQLSGDVDNVVELFANAGDFAAWEGEGS